MTVRQRKPWNLFGNPLSIRVKRRSSSSSSHRTVRSRRRSLFSGGRFSRLTRRQKLRLILKWFGLFLGGFVLFTLLLFAVYAKDLPNPTNLSSRQVNESTKILDRNGNSLYEIFNEERRTVVTSDKISKYIKEATVSVEDNNFYHHHGLDPKSIVRALLVDVLHRSSFTQGGSTITQQFIKNTLLTKERSLSRKIKEAILAVEVESIYSKDEILAGYLNEIAYGNNAYGIETAARIYFGKSAADLNLSESAILAAIPQRPSYFSPYGSHLEELFARKDYVLDQMVKTGYITKEEADAAKKAAPNKESPQFAKRSESIQAPHFVFYVRDQLADMLGGGQEAEQRLAQGGYTVTTTLDLETQKMAEEAVNGRPQAIMQKYNASNAGIVAIDPKTGDVLAMVGSVDFFNDKWGSVNVANSPRQPGSSFKPIVYATGFKGKYSPATLLFDLKTDFGGGYNPSDYDGKTRGPLTARQALSWSLNIPAVKMLDLVGIDEALKTAKDLGITTLTNRDQYGLSLVLGAGEVKLVELVHAYSVFANEGTSMPLTSILKIQEKNGNTMLDITNKERKGEQVLDPQVAWLMSDILSDMPTKAVIFGNSLVIPNHTVASKTGTTQSFRDAWTLGYTPQIAVGVWVGNNDNTAMTKGADGSIVAAPIWRNFLNAYLADKPNLQFNRPDGVNQVTVDKLSTKLPNEGCTQDTVTDWFAKWNTPTERSDVNQLVKLDRVSGMLATDQTPADQIDTKCFRTIHSERPDRPNWEAPVQAWAAANGYTDAPPTEFDNVHTTESQPKVNILTPTNGQGVGKQITASVTVEAKNPIDRVEFYVGDVMKVSTNTTPYTVQILDVPTGEQTIKVIAFDNVQNQGEATVLVKVNENGGNYPGDVSNVKVSLSVKNVSISWTNPSDDSLTSVRVYESNNSGTLGSLSRTVAASPKSNAFTTLVDHPSGTFYYTLRTVDKNNNENPSTAQYVATVP